MKKLMMAVCVMLMGMQSMKAQGLYELTGKAPFTIRFGQLSRYLDLQPSQQESVYRISEAFMADQQEALSRSARKEELMTRALHANLKQMKEALTVKRVYIYAGAMGAEEYDELSMLCRNNNVELLGISRGDVLMDGELKFSVLSPGTGGHVNTIEMRSLGTNLDTTSNNASLVMYIKYKDFDMLTTGDVEDEGEKDILRSGILDEFISNDKSSDNKCIDVLKVAHHGSSGSSSLSFLSEIKPEISLISVGARNQYGHPHEETLERLEALGGEILRTDELGCIKFTVTPSGEVKKEGYRCSVGL